MLEAGVGPAAHPAAASRRRRRPRAPHRGGAGGAVADRRRRTPTSCGGSTVPSLPTPPCWPWRRGGSAVPATWRSPPTRRHRRSGRSPSRRRRRPVRPRHGPSAPAGRPARARGVPRPARRHRTAAGRGRRPRRAAERDGEQLDPERDRWTEPPSTSSRRCSSSHASGTTMDATVVAVARGPLHRRAPGARGAGGRRRGPPAGRDRLRARRGGGSDDTDRAPRPGLIAGDAVHLL